jgi:membrane protein implicated in regulation of membrane protease activity
MATIDNRSVPELLADALTQFSKLISNELQLAKAEMSAKVTQAIMAAAFLAIAGLVAIPVLVLLLIAFAAWLAEMGWSDPAAYLASAVLGLVISGVLAWIGMNRLKASNLTPNRTLEQLRRDAQAMKGAAS